jgi:hypothetical protein
MRRRKRIVALDFPDLDEPMPIYVKLDAPEISIWFREAEGYTFDGSGRPYAGFCQHRRYRRALDGRLIETAWGEGPPRQRPRLIRVHYRREAMQMLSLWRDRLAPLLSHVKQGKVHIHGLHTSDPTPTTLNEVEALLTKVLAWNEARLNDDIAHYHHVYQPVSILPPDQYVALYIQLTTGCSYNRCLFCEFYRDRRYHVRTKEEFFQHLAAVEAYFGPALAMRKRIFLGDANALHMDERSLRERFAALHLRFSIGQNDKTPSKPQFDGIYSFIDSFTGVRLSVTLLQHLSKTALRRVYIGFETGHEPLRRYLQKPGHTSQVITTVRNLKQAGISVGVILLNGIGGPDMVEKHVGDSVSALEAMDLEPQDIIFLSDLVVSSDSEYAQVASETGWEIRGAEALLRQRLAFIDAIRQTKSASCAKIAHYDVREFVY